MNHRHGSWRMASMAASLVLMGGLVSAGGSGGTLPMWPKGFSLVPQNALAVLSLEKGGKLLKKAGPGAELFLARLARWMGADKKEIARAFLEGPFTAALFSAQEGAPSLLLVFPGGRKGPEELLSRLGRGPGAYRPAGRMGGAEVGSYTLAPPVGLRLFSLHRGDTFLAATSKDLLARALEAEASPATKSLQADIALARIFRDCGFQEGGGIFLSFKKGLFRGGPAVFFSPGEEKSWVSWMSRLTEKGVETRVRLEWPEPRSGWGALAGGKSWPGSLEKAFPGPKDLVVAAGLILPQAPKGKAKGNSPLLPELERVLPLPWRRIMPALSGDFVLRVKAKNEKGGRLAWAALLDLTNPSRADKVLRAPGKAWRRKWESTAAGYTVHTLEDSSGRRFSWALAGGRLYLGTGPDLLARALARAPGDSGGEEKPLVSPGGGPFLRARGDTAALALLLPPFFRSFLEGCEGPFELEGWCDPAGVGFRFFHAGSPPGLPFLKSLRLPRVPSREGLAAREGKATSGTDWASLSPKERFEALTSLERAGDVLIYAEEVESLLDDPDPAVAARAAYALGENKVESAVPRLCKVLRDSPNPEVRRYAAYALSRMPDPREEGFLIQALEDEDPWTRGYAATALEKLGAAKAARPLARALLADPKAPKEVRLRILSALAELGGPREIPKVLLGVGPKEDVDLLRAQVYALQKLTPQLARPEEEDLLAKLLDSPSAYVKGYAVDRLGEIGGPAAAKALERRLPLEGPQFAKRIHAALDVVKTRSGPQLAFKKVVDAASRKMLLVREKMGKAVAEVRTWPAWKKGALACVPLVLAGLLFMLWRWLRARAAMKAHMRLITLVSSPEEEEGFEMEEPGPGFEDSPDADVAWEETQAEEEWVDPEADQVYLEDQEELEEMVPLEEEENLNGPA